MLLLSTAFFKNTTIYCNSLPNMIILGLSAVHMITFVYDESTQMLIKNSICGYCTKQMSFQMLI